MFFMLSDLKILSNDNDAFPTKKSKNWFYFKILDVKFYGLSKGPTLNFFPSNNVSKYYLKSGANFCLVSITFFSLTTKPQMQADHFK